MPTLAENTKILTELYSYTPSAILELFVLDLTPLDAYYNSIGINISPLIYRFHGGANERAENPALSGTDVIWQGNTYEARPISFSGLEISSAGQVPTPLLEIANADKLLTELVIEFGGLVGAAVIRKRTFLKFIDAANFIGGTNPTADQNAYFPDDVFRIDRMAEELPGKISFDLSPSWDVEGVQLPRRQVIANICPWTYKSDPCTWVPGVGQYFTSADIITTDAAQDQCGKRYPSCKLRFGNRIMPFGGFPSAGLYGKPL